MGTFGEIKDLVKSSNSFQTGGRDTHQTIDSLKVLDRYFRVLNLIS